MIGGWNWVWLNFESILLSHTARIDSWVRNTDAKYFKDTLNRTFFFFFVICTVQIRIFSLICPWSRISDCCEIKPPSIWKKPAFRLWRQDLSYLSFFGTDKRRQIRETKNVGRSCVIFLVTGSLASFLFFSLLFSSLLFSALLCSFMLFSVLLCSSLF